MERRRITTAMANLYHIGRTTDPCIPQLVPQAWQILALLNADVPRVQLVVQVSRHFRWCSKLSVPVPCSITAQPGWDVELLSCWDRIVIGYTISREIDFVPLIWWVIYSDKVCNYLDYYLLLSENPYTMHIVCLNLSFVNNNKPTVTITYY